LIVILNIENASIVSDVSLMILNETMVTVARSITLNE